MDRVDAMAVPTQTCYRHPGRPAGVTCQRCGRPICPDCMTQASVGFHCPECLSAGAQRVRTMRDLVAFRPIVTEVLVALNAAVLLLVTLDGANLANGEGSTIAHRLAVIAGPPWWPGGVGTGEWWRLVTSGFLHWGLAHFALNMLFLWIVGRPLEKDVGHVNFAAIYMVSLLAGSAGALMLAPDALSAGASGALYGLMGALLIIQHKSGIDPWRSGLIGLIVINLMLTLYLGLSLGGHLGGLVGGLVAGFAVFEAERRTRSPYVPALICAGLAVLFALLGVWAANYAVANLHGVI
jgi:membrane associated rhomboid family serine protease